MPFNNHTSMGQACRVEGGGVGGGGDNRLPRMNFDNFGKPYESWRTISGDL